MSINREPKFRELFYDDAISDGSKSKEVSM